MTGAAKPREQRDFAALQRRLAPLFRDLLGDPRAPRTVVVVPGLSVDQELLGRIDGLQHYEERQLTMLMLLRLSGTRIVFVTSTPIDPVIVDYYLSLLPGIPLYACDATTRACVARSSCSTRAHPARATPCSPSTARPPTAARLRSSRPTTKCSAGLPGRSSSAARFRPTSATGSTSSALEINLRKGGTTHTFQAPQYLTHGQYDESTAGFRLPSGETRGYRATGARAAAA